MPSTETKREATYDETMNMQDRARIAADKKARDKKDEQDKMKKAVKKVQEKRITPRLDNRKEILDQAEKEAGI